MGAEAPATVLEPVFFLHVGIFFRGIFLAVKNLKLAGAVGVVDILTIKNHVRHNLNGLVSVSQFVHIVLLNS